MKILHFEKSAWLRATMKNEELRKNNVDFMAGFCNKLKRFYIIIW
jgi:hypothetical protein